MLVFIVVENEF